MDNYTATEQAYKNGYEQGQRDAVKHGRWIVKLGRLPVCGHCSKTLYMARGAVANYCPNCGATMDLEVTDETD